MVWYLLNSEDILVSVADDWDLFALENGGCDAVSQKVVGQDLWTFISCDETAAFLRNVFHFCRTHDTAFMMPYRCDSPVQKRVFDMRIDPLPDGSLLVGHKLAQISEYSVEDVKTTNAKLCQCMMCREVAIISDQETTRVTSIIPPVDLKTYICADCMDLAEQQMQEDQSVASLTESAPVPRVILRN